MPLSHFLEFLKYFTVGVLFSHMTPSGWLYWGPGGQPWPLALLLWLEHLPCRGEADIPRCRPFMLLTFVLCSPNYMYIACIFVGMYVAFPRGLVGRALILLLLGHRWLYSIVQMQ